MGGMKDLFGDQLWEPNRNARRSDPVTSKLAAEDVKTQSARDRSKVYAIFKEHHPTPLADFEIEQLLGGSQNGKWRKRRSDLKDDGILIAADQVVNPNTNKLVMRWKLVEKEAS